jgi:hypothetical protein
MRELSTKRLAQRPAQITSSKIITHFQEVQKSSARLHDILASKWPCDERNEHVVSMSLNVENVEKCRQKASKVRFTLFLTCIPENSVGQREPLRLKIESAPGEQTASQVVIGGMAEDPTAFLQAKLRSVRFEIPSRIGNNITTIANVVSRDSANIPETLLDLGAIGKLCQYFQRQQQRQPSGEPCLGFLERTKTFKHFVYPSPTPRVSSTITERRLKEILQNDFEERRQETWTEKLSLARLLTLAVLRFQDTPWLAESWGSNDISFYNIDERPQHVTSLQSPFLNVRLSNTTSSQTEQITHPEYKASSISPNSTLFSLGVVLLELGYDAPLEALRHEDDLRGGANKQFTDFFTALRLSKLVSKRLNLRYGKLVQKCLACNFGVGTELESPELQSAIVVNVVNELDECLKIFDNFNSVIPSSGYPV